MSTLINSRSEIPKAICYVTCTDKLFSGWGMSDGLNNRCIFPCETYEEADRLVSYAESRSEMKNIRICYDKPKLNLNINTYSLFDRECARAWYPKKDTE